MQTISIGMSVPDGSRHDWETRLQNALARWKGVGLVIENDCELSFPSSGGDHGLTAEFRVEERYKVGRIVSLVEQFVNRRTDIRITRKFCEGFDFR